MKTTNPSLAHQRLREGFVVSRYAKALLIASRGPQTILATTNDRRLWRGDPQIALKWRRQDSNDGID